MKRKPRRAAWIASAVVMAMAAYVPLVRAQPTGYPVKPVRLIAPSSPGSGVDIVARVVAQHLAPQLGQQVIVEDRPGAGANLGAEIAARAPADGYTLFMGTPAHAINASFYSRLNYDLLRDFAPVSMITTGQYIVIVHPSLPVHSIKELIALAKSKPGVLSFGSGGRGNATHLAGELFGTMASVSMLHVPYKGSGPALTDLMAGQVDLMFANLTAGLPHVRSGRLRALAVTGEKRSAIVPDLPTVAESGLPGYFVTSYYAMFVPVRTPRQVIDRLNDAVVATMRSADLKRRLTAEGAEPASSTPEELAAFVKSEIEKWSKVVTSAHARAD